MRGRDWDQGVREGSLQKLGGSYGWKRRWDASEGQDSCYWGRRGSEGKGEMEGGR